MMESVEETTKKFLFSHAFPDIFPGQGPRAPNIVCTRWFVLSFSFFFPSFVFLPLPPSSHCFFSRGEWTVKDPVGAVFIVHGLGEHAGRYEKFALELNKNNLLVFGMDHRGHGKSEGTRMYADTLDELIADIDTHIELVLHNLPEEMPVVVFGHSMGGLLTSVYGSRTPSSRIRGIVLSGPAIR
jgi:pimeloyl-ACP methyl ester carboxylesterase